MGKGKKVKSLLPQKKETKVSANLSNIQKILDKTTKDIQKGLDNPYASTGTPIDKLTGGAKFMAQMSNIGGGSVKTGGGGVKQGFNTVTNNIKAKAVVQTGESLLKAIGKKKK